MERDGFLNRRHRFSYLIAMEHVRLIRQDPRRLDFAAEHIERRLPEYRAGEDAWRRLLADGVEAVAKALMERSEAGDYARETAPSFGGIPAQVRYRLLQKATETLGSGDPAAW